MSKEVIVSNIEIDENAVPKVKGATKISSEEEKVTLLQGQSIDLGNGVVLTADKTKEKSKRKETEEKEL